ncbi:hypothetical protein BZB76_5600 [Actinomadura pelletieri DSM 43383]|uniref:Uncharacterized protein n=1 Tax=Actinomadura pelletieri DSM 43383 TaxID=1120940 RepID=A0A495QGV6_9ACTN|nr:hypothetical protein [Actinomadura pelletieri]RKS71114.1 hypothetical protein BZB76_5600 [Actinomadura pelletieri DSM 43383]
MTDITGGVTMGLGSAAIVASGFVVLNFTIESSVPLAASCLAAIPIISLTLSNPIGMAKAAMAWNELQNTLGTALAAWPTDLEKEDWQGAGREEFDTAIRKIKQEFEQVKTAGTNMATAMWAVLAGYVALYIAMISFWWAVRAVLIAWAAGTPLTRPAAEATGAAAVAATGGAVSALGAMLTAAGAALAAVLTQFLGGLFLTDTNDLPGQGSDFTKIKLKYPVVTVTKP